MLTRVEFPLDDTRGGVTIIPIERELELDEIANTSKIFRRRTRSLIRRGNSKSGDEAHRSRELRRRFYRYRVSGIEFAGDASPSD